MKHCISAVLLLLCPLLLQARPLLDLVDIQGVRDNQLVGYGLVVGLPGSGDKAQIRFAAQSLNNMLKQFGVQLDENSLPKSKNVAAVAVTATLPANASPGQTMDVTIMSLGDAKSLHGGSLMLTPLRGVDGKVYALAQGNLVVLEQQDRSVWDRERIEEGCELVRHALRSRGYGAYTVQAAIAAVHAEAATADATDWDEIVGLYDVLQRYWPSAVVA